MAGLLSVGYFLVSLIFNLLLLILWIRIALKYFRVSTLHPVGQVVHRFTDPFLGPIERLVYPQNKRVPRYDWICLAAIFLVEIIKFFLLGFLVYKIALPIIYLLLFAVADLIVQPCNLLFYALLIRVILSWINPMWQQHPAADILKLVTNPLIFLGRKIIPDISGFDFAPFIMMVILKVITLFISASMPLPLM